VLDFRFPVRRNARVSVGLSERKLRLDLHNLYSTQQSGITVLLRSSSPADANKRNVHPCGACHSSVRPLQECILHGTGRVSSLDSSTSTSSSRVPFTPATVNSPSTLAMLALALSSSSSTPHSVEFNFGFCYVEFNSFLIRALRFLSREPTHSLHT